MECWICRRNKEELNEEFNEFEIEGKDYYVCVICSTLIELLGHEEE